MEQIPATSTSCIDVPMSSLASHGTSAGTEDLGNGFRHHGVPTPVSNHRGTVATLDADGRDVVLVWLFDHRGGYALLMIDAETGESAQFAMPFPPAGDSPYASILSSRNRFYTHFNSHFVEFDPTKRAFTFCGKTKPQMAMGMTEDDNGVIWSVTYPNSGVVSYDPATGELVDYGHVYQQNWRQYQRHVATDDTGWLYFGVGHTASQIIAFDPHTGKATAMVPEAERTKGSGYVYRNVNGRVYGQGTPGPDSDWYELYGGRKVLLGKEHTKRPKRIVTGHQGLFHSDFPDGKRLEVCDTVSRRLSVKDPKSGQTAEHTFDYHSEGAHVMGMAVAPDRSICGGTAFPMRFFRFDPKTDEWTNREAYGQWNTVARQGDRFFVGGYGGGFLLEWDPSRDWVTTRKGDKHGNPLYHTECTPTIHRPHDLLAHPDGKTVVLAGTPDYGYTGGGLLLWKRDTRTRRVLEHTQILPEHATMALVPLPDGKLLGGTTTSPGTGGEKKAKQAELYILEMESGTVEWHEPLFAGRQYYADLCSGPNGLVYGFAERDVFFVFDPAKRIVAHQQDTLAMFGPTTYHQGPRIFVKAPDNATYILFAKGIGRIDPASFKITLMAQTPVTVGAGGDILDGRVYFASGSHVYSYELPR